MNPRLWNWILAGALAGSMTLLARGWTRAPGEPAASGCGPQGCSLDLAGLELTAEQREQLSVLCPPEACAADLVSEEARVSCAALFGALADPAADAADLRERARALGELRTRELERCVETILEVRKVLTDEQLQALLERCCARREM